MSESPPHDVPFRVRLVDSATGDVLLDETRRVTVDAPEQECRGWGTVVEL